MNQDKRKLVDPAVVVVSTQQQQRQQEELMITTRLTPFSIDNILGRPRDQSPANQPLLPFNRPSDGLTENTRGTGDQTGYMDTTRVLMTTPRHIHVPTHVSASTGEMMTSTNLDELQTFLNSKLRHQHQHQHQPALPAAAPHHHYHPHQSSHLSQQQTGVMPTGFYTQFHRHLGILPSSIDGIVITLLYQICAWT